MSRDTTWQNSVITDERIGLSVIVIAAGMTISRYSKIKIAKSCRDERIWTLDILLYLRNQVAWNSCSLKFRSKVSKDYNHEIGYETLQKDFEVYKKQTLFLQKTKLQKSMNAIFGFFLVSDLI